MKKKIKKEILLNVPNAITLLRLILVFVFVFMLFNNYPKIYLISVFIVAALSDWFDGFFARKFKQTTKVGARMDQVVDRIFTIVVVVALLLFYYNNPQSQNIILLLFLVSSREIIATPGFLIVLVRGKESYNVKYIGKITTFIQSVALGVIIIGVGWAVYLAVATCILGIVSGLDYLRYSLT